MFKALNYLWDLVVGGPKTVTSEQVVEVWLYVCRYMPYLNLDNQNSRKLGIFGQMFEESHY